ncbi:hypothetical protein J2790_001173 [Paenarthrobacter nicotinovorans]|nr:hypothetical protein [Paenarthrobacter nicotinovorans]SCZ51474.1 hypothetical protein SAMN02799638_00919 [Arthrobacter sp. UNCCL28]
MNPMCAAYIPYDNGLSILTRVASGSFSTISRNDENDSSFDSNFQLR